MPFHSARATFASLQKAFDPKASYVIHKVNRTGWQRSRFYNTSLDRAGWCSCLSRLHSTHANPHHNISVAQFAVVSNCSVFLDAQIHAVFGKKAFSLKQLSTLNILLCAYHFCSVLFKKDHPAKWHLGQPFWKVCKKASPVLVLCRLGKFMHDLWEIEVGM